MIFLHSLLREDPLLHCHLDRGPDGGQHVEEDCGQEYTTASTAEPYLAQGSISADNLHR